MHGTEASRKSNLRNYVEHNVKVASAEEGNPKKIH